jgi:hypothetical protein
MRSLPLVGQRVKQHTMFSLTRLLLLPVVRHAKMTWGSITVPTVTCFVPHWRRGQEVFSGGKNKVIWAKKQVNLRFIPFESIFWPMHATFGTVWGPADRCTLNLKHLIQAQTGLMRKTHTLPLHLFTPTLHLSFSVLGGLSLTKVVWKSGRSFIQPSLCRHTIRRGRKLN